MFIGTQEEAKAATQQMMEALALLNRVDSQLMVVQGMCHLKIDKERIAGFRKTIDEEHQWLESRFQTAVERYFR